MNVSQIETALRAQVQNGQLVLNNDTLTQSGLPPAYLDKLLNLLDTVELVFRNPEITVGQDGVELTGTVTLPGAPDIALEASFKDSTLDFSAKAIPVYTLPSATWLVLHDVQLALHITGDHHDVSGTLGGTVQIGGDAISSVFLVGKQQDELTLQWTIANLDLVAISQTFLGDAALPPELPAIVFKNVETTLHPQSRTFAFQATATTSYAFPADAQGVSISQTQISFSRSGSGEAAQIECALTLQGENRLQIAEDLSLDRVKLAFQLKGQEWSLAGDVDATVLARSLQLSAEYSQTETEKSFKLTTAVDPALTILDFDTAGHLQLAAVAIAWQKERTTDPANPPRSSWNLMAKGALVVSDALDMAGQLTLAKQNDGTASLVFQPEAATAHLLLPPDQTAAIDLTFGDLSIQRIAQALHPEWQVEAAVTLGFRNWKPAVQKYLSDAIQASFKADGQGVTITADRVLKPFDYAIPDIEFSQNNRVALGNASIDVTDLKIHLGKEIDLAAQLGIGLPAKLNNLFGTNPDGSAAIEFFNTFDASDRENTVIKTELSIGTAGIKIAPKSSIIKAVHLVEEAGETFWYCTLGNNGEFGEVKFKVPEFSYDTSNSSFKASGAFETVKPLALPLTPAKLLLSACKLQAAADALPASIPLKEVKIVDDQGHFKLDTLMAELGDVGAKLPQEVKDGLSLIGDRLDHLPDSFKQYLNIEIPQSFAFNIAVTPEGTVSFEARVKEGDPPIKLLSAGFLGAIPTLNGISLRSISFGELAGGSLFQLQVDATFDQFDLPTLVASLALPDIQNSPLPPTRSLHRRLVLNNLFLILVYETVIPIPIPLFYDEVGIEYLGLEGVQLGAHAQFPMPSLDLREAGKLLANFKQFFTDRAYLLDPQAAPEHMNLKFSLKQNFLELPAYLGGKTLGNPTDGPTIDAYQSLAHLLNGMKTLSVSDLIQTTPLEKRIGDVGVAFGPLVSEIGWLVTTPKEFSQIAAQPALKQQTYTQLHLANDAQASSLLSILPTTVNSDGLVVFLKGACAVSNLASFETAFGLAASGAGFYTGFSLKGQISNVMEMGLTGRVAIQGGSTAGNSAFSLQGQSYLNLAGQPIFTGDVQMDDRRFRCQGAMNLYGLGGSVAMTIDGAKGAELRGDLNPVTLGNLFKLSGVNGKPNPSVLLQIVPNQMPSLDISGAVELLGMRSETHVSVSNQGFLFSANGNLFNRFGCALQVSGKHLNSAIDFQVVATMQTDLFQFIKQQATQVVKQAADDAQSKIASAQGQVKSAQDEVNRLQGVIDQQRRIVQGERDTAQRRFNDAQQAVINEQNRVNNLANTIHQKEAERDQLARQQSCTTIRVWVPTPSWRKPWDGHWENKTTCVPDPVAVSKAGVLQGEITGLYTQLGTEQAGLKAAQGALELARKGLDLTPIDLDPRVAGPLAAMKTAQGALIAAQGTLEVTRRGVAAGASAADYIAQHGLDSLVQVSAARFAADLNTAAGGQVSLAVNLTYKGTNSNLTVNFNFNDPLSSARALGQKLLSL